MKNYTFSNPNYFNPNITANHCDICRCEWAMSFNETEETKNLTVHGTIEFLRHVADLINATQEDRDNIENL